MARPHPDNAGAGEVLVRPYQTADRPQVRYICHVTGYMGEPVDWLWRDTESFGNPFTSSYTDGEPESALVAELDGTVAGYLLGCVDSRTTWNPAAIFGRHLVRRGIGLRPGTAGVVWRSLGDVALDAMHRRLPPFSAYDERWPAHLHIDLLPAIRGHGVGARLMHRWLETLQEMRVPGCHLETLGQNDGAIAFFESMGFRRHDTPVPAPGLRSPTGDRLTIQRMVRSLER
jgi:ribosomal protein S18 acetylase RimI-like enzyme